MPIACAYRLSPIAYRQSPIAYRLALPVRSFSLESFAAMAACMWGCRLAIPLSGNGWSASMDEARALAEQGLKPHYVAQVLQTDRDNLMREKLSLKANVPPTCSLTVSL